MSCHTFNYKTALNSLKTSNKNKKDYMYLDQRRQKFYSWRNIYFEQIYRADVEVCTS